MLFTWQAGICQNLSEFMVIIGFSTIINLNVGGWKIGHILGRRIHLTKDYVNFRMGWLCSGGNCGGQGFCQMPLLKCPIYGKRT
jgi:hypothetical protein